MRQRNTRSLTFRPVNCRSIIYYLDQCNIQNSHYWLSIYYFTSNTLVESSQYIIDKFDLLIICWLGENGISSLNLDIVQASPLCYSQTPLLFSYKCPPSRTAVNVQLNKAYSKFSVLHHVRLHLCWHEILSFLELIIFIYHLKTLGIISIFEGVGDQTLFYGLLCY